MPYNILISEDDIRLTMYLEKSLVREGFFVDIANDGEIALEKWKENSYDLVILDLITPKVLGRELVFYIRDESDIPIIIVTGQGTENDKEDLTPLVCAYLEKPVDLNVLIDEIRRCCITITK